MSNNKVCLEYDTFEKLLNLSLWNCQEIRKFNHIENYKNLEKKIIKNIYILWFQGFNNAPELVKNCVESWKHYNPDWKIILLDDNNLKNYFKYEDYNISFKDKKYSKTHISDVVRTILLKKYGGLWTDSTTFCTKPLSSWLPNHIEQDFFAFEKIEKDNLISNWFLYSKPNSYMINKILDDVIEYVNKNDVIDDYFIYHHTFFKRYKKDIIFKNKWDKIPKISAHPPHFIQEKGMFSKLTDEVKNHIDNKKANVYKLTWKSDYKKNNENSNISYLFSTIRK